MHIQMYVCMYVCMHVWMHVWMHACMCVRVYVCMHVCMYVCMHACMYVYMLHALTISMSISISIPKTSATPPHSAVSAKDHGHNLKPSRQESVLIVRSLYLACLPTDLPIQRPVARIVLTSSPLAALVHAYEGSTVAAC